MTYKKANIKKQLIFIIILSCVFALPVNAQLNNKFGIHLAQPHFEDIKQAADMINSNGGKWGYVTVVIQENDRNTQKWQAVFDLLRENHLIPIVRLATSPDGDNWRRPIKEEIDEWISFLNSLNWVVKERYIILFNEPNHAKEWGGEVDAKNYADIALDYARQLKNNNKDYFVMLAGLDASAPSSLPNFEDEEIFLRHISGSNTGLFNLIDGWSSHSYPNPGFAGSPIASGRGTVRTYQWELELLKELGVKKDLPVFITETGWIHSYQSSITEEVVAENFKLAFENIWLPDDRVVAVTPFVFNYQSEPFLGFSWRKFNSDGYYQQYYTIQSMNKTAGEPAIRESGQISFDLPKELVANSSYNFKIKLKNTGQAIWDKDDGYELKLDGFKKENYFFNDIKKIHPFEDTEVNLSLKTGSVSGEIKGQLVLYKKDDKIMAGGTWHVKILPLPSLGFTVSLFPKLKTEGHDFEVQIFDDKQNLIFKKAGLTVSNGVGNIDNIQNIIPGQKYRLVVLKNYYLPRQTISAIKKNKNTVKFAPLLPLDANRDGKWSSEDIAAFFNNFQLLKLFIP